MRRYYKGSVSVKKSQLVVRILIVAIVCIAVFCLTVLYGNHLLKKAAESVERGNGTYVEEKPTAEDTADDGKSYAAKMNADSSKLRHNLAYVDMTESESEIYTDIDEAYADGADGIAVVIKDADGVLRYASKSISAVLGVQYAENLPDGEKLASAVGYAKAKMMTVSAVFEVSVDLDDNETAVYDELIVAELSEAGVDEIILTGVFDRTRPDDTGVERYLTYLTRLRSNAPRMYFGVVIDSAYYESAVLAPQLEEIFKYTDIMLADLRSMIASAEDVTAEITGFHSRLTGSIAHYNLRVITDVSDDEALITALSDSALTNKMQIPKVGADG